MSLRVYPAYRESAVGWLDSAPAHWTDTRLRFVARLNPSKSEVADRDRSEEVSFLPMDAVGDDGSLRLDHTRPLGEVETGYTYFRDGDVAVAKITPCFENSKGAVMRGLTGGVGFGTTELIVARPLPGNSPDFLHWLFTSTPFRKLGEGSMYGAGGQKRVADDFVRDFRVVLPPPEEQTAIAVFLDREAGKIDALVEAQRRLIHLLKEKRQAVISHAVTKGLDPAAPMKDSGVEWLGEVPAHWSVKRLKSVAHIQTGVAKGKDNGSSETVQVPYLRVANVQDGWIDLSDVATIELPTSDVGRYRLQAGDVLMNEGGDFDKLGRGGIWHGQIDPCVHQNHVFSVRPFSVSPEWLSLTTGSVGAQFFFKGRSKQSTNLASISSTNLMELPILVPPRKEQQEIVDYLTGLIDGSDDLTDEAGKAIALLQERRSALISAAVTGKIDVRQQAEVPSAIDQPTARRLVGAAVLELVADNPGSGRMTSAKRMYLAEAHAGVWELRGQPERRAAGPFDSALMREVEAELARVGHIASTQPGGPNTQVLYSLTGSQGALRADLDALLGDRRAVFDRMLADLATLESRGVEAVATLYAVWNDMLIDGQTPTGDAVIDGVLNDWHAEKRDKFTRPDLVNYLGWMRRHDLTPSGRGPRTKSGALL